MPLLERCLSLLVRVATSPRPAVLAAAGACALFRPAKAEVCAALMASGDVPAPSRTLDLSVVVACHRMLDCAAILLFCPFAVCALSPGRLGSGGNGEPEGGAGAHAKRAPPQGPPICYFRAPPRAGSLLDLLSISPLPRALPMLNLAPGRRWT